MCAILTLINVYVMYMLPLTTPTAYIIWIPAWVVEIVLVAAWSRVTWICAPNVKHRLWMYLARGWIVLWLLSQVRHTLLNG
ncbi:hypothetical protein [Burkholderia sp. F1]|uniref:hypothetical protein n=1 Tax=Burkholderia sp. F1 TaxID=3366817 RepID=UPI003D7241E3